MKIEDSYIRYNSKGEVTSYVGPDATRYYQVKVLMSGLGMLKQGIKINRHATPTILLKMAGQYTGKQYKQRQYDEALADLQIWATNMLLALPIVTEEKVA